jgi:hypothetical protein
MPAVRTPLNEGRRIIICDYNALLLSVTGLLRMSGYRVFQAYDAAAVEELCFQLPKIDLVILNTFGAGGRSPRSGPARPRDQAGAAHPPHRGRNSCQPTPGRADSRRDVYSRSPAHDRRSPDAERARRIVPLPNGPLYQVKTRHF